ncbi:SIR2 family NAD-dependent protein deacylase [Denitromonas ohlonensis]|uniref:protein acetyllysine N-acetyltransferase n=2 Tax=Denitromonas TaxID=139331 RepID=A0A558E7M3_9RHOO|nr:NAD-dependent protein deacylase [Denitromonas ohlonensis]TVO67560.1 NAD-dependent protein deacylase [Denitromonas ohlonensis]TVO76418.1 NAD-dependent protein deacylase [Denitromonas ohlonensis]TVT69364.1 MAG: NAD-dependent protein deacylase [Denitromonas halophila]
MSDSDTLAAVTELLRQAKRILFITGAGLSADSGLPTYRGIGGLYDDKLTGHGIPIEKALSGQMMANRPEVSWTYLAQIEANCRGAQPNAAHHAIARLVADRPGSMVFTQNVDGFHRDVGTANLVEIHGNLHQLECTECGRGRRVPDYAGLQMPPGCPTCGGVMRPDVVLFGEDLPRDGILRLEHMLVEGVDLVMSIGTSSAFPYIAGPVMWAADAGVPTVEINPGETRVSAQVTHRLQMGAAHALGEILTRLGVAA